MSSSTPASSTTTAISTSSWSTPKAVPEDILVQITAVNRGPEAAELHLLPTLWFRNDWSAWIARPRSEKPNLKQIKGPAGTSAVAAAHPLLGEYRPFLRRRGAAALYRERNQPRAAFPDNPNASPYVKDGINDCVVLGHQEAVNPDKHGHQGRGALPAQCRRRADRRRCACGSPTGPCREAGKPEARTPFGTEFDEDPGRPASGGRRVLPVGDPAFGLRGRGQRHAPGHRRHALEQAVLLLRR